MKVFWSEVAENDLDGQIRYIAQDSVDAALRIEDRILARVQALQDNPRLGRIGRAPGTRELVIPHTAFLAVYQIDGLRITILRLLHGAQRWPAAPGRADEA